MRTHLPTRTFVPETSKLNTRETVKKESIKTCVNQVNVGSMTGKQLKHKLKEVKSVEKQKGSKKNRNGKVGITKSNNHLPVSDSPRKACYNFGSSNHLASFYRKNKKINSLPSNSGVKKISIRVLP